MTYRMLQFCRNVGFLPDWNSVPSLFSSQFPSQFYPFGGNTEDTVWGKCNPNESIVISGVVSDSPNEDVNVHTQFDVIGEPGGAQALSARGRAMLVNGEKEGPAAVIVFMTDCPTKDIKTIQDEHGKVLQLGRSRTTASVDVNGTSSSSVFQFHQDVVSWIKETGKKAVIIQVNASSTTRANGSSPTRSTEINEEHLENAKKTAPSSRKFIVDTCKKFVGDSKFGKLVVISCGVEVSILSQFLRSELLNSTAFKNVHRMAARMYHPARYVRQVNGSIEDATEVAKSILLPTEEAVSKQSIQRLSPGEIWTTDSEETWRMRRSGKGKEDDAFSPAKASEDANMASPKPDTVVNPAPSKVKDKKKMPAAKVRQCVHGKANNGYLCKLCPGKGICDHGRQRNLCIDCGGSQICKHRRQRSTCKQCGGSQTCEHGRRRSRCKQCGGGSICDHGRIRSQCKKCKGSKK